MQQDLGVRPTPEMRAAGGELRGQHAKVVDGAVEDDPQRSVRQHHRLPPRTAEVEYGEAPMTEDRTRPAFDALAIGPTPGQGAGHALNRLQRRGRALRPDYSGNPAHSILRAANRPITSDNVFPLPPRTIHCRRGSPVTVSTTCGRSSG